jgi:hypothetical protein
MICAHSALKQTAQIDGSGAHIAMCGRRVRGFAIDLIPELVRTGRA